VKAVYQCLGAEGRGHSVTQLLATLPAEARPSEELIEVAKELDKHYIAPRCPNSYPEGAPLDFYTRGEALRAVEGAGRVVEHCKRHVLR
jgi:HEPN domain-containing protein